MSYRRKNVILLEGNAREYIQKISLPGEGPGSRRSIVVSLTPKLYRTACQCYSSGYNLNTVGYPSHPDFVSFLCDAPTPPHPNAHP